MDERAAAFARLFQAVHEGVYIGTIGPDGTSTLAANPHLTAVAGAVFDMSRARPKHDCLKALLGGKDTTLFHLRRLDTSDGTETLQDVRENRLDAAQRRYLNAYLHGYAEEYRYVGRYSFDP